MRSRLFEGTRRSGVKWSVVLAAALTLLLAAPLTFAQADLPPAGSTVRVANTDGQALNLRAGPSVARPVLARLNPGTLLTVTGPGQGAGAVRWVPVRAPGGEAGWVSAEYLAIVSTPSPTQTPALTPTAIANLTPTAPVAEATPKPKGGPVEVEAKLKYPETDGREQEITVWVTRGGVPIPGAVVTIETNDGDDELFRQLDPTDENGRTRRSFDIRHEKGTVEIQVEAVAPDGGEGRATVSYFRR